ITGGPQTYAFRIVLEHERKRWTAYCPQLLPYGASVTGKTKQEVLLQINRRVCTIVAKLARKGESILQTGLVETI
ncbi:MAG TPA: hypothetical protein VES69_13900, partial [Pyrinomonadaceae bacterium]|nr:hypothetical protein [Pyrinomonadaceae bacterium]